MVNDNKMLEGNIVSMVSAAFPEIQAVYFFGSRAVGEEGEDSDYDLALLLPVMQAKEAGSLAMSDLQFALEGALVSDVDLINLREVSTVFQHEIVTYGRQIFCGNEYACDEFEALTLSFYQKLNEERAEILADFKASGRAYAL